MWRFYLHDDVIVVFAYVARNNHYPDTLGFEADFADAAERPGGHDRWGL